MSKNFAETDDFIMYCYDDLEDAFNGGYLDDEFVLDLCKENFFSFSDIDVNAIRDEFNDMLERQYYREAC